MAEFDLNKEYFYDISQKCRYNEKIAMFYERFSEMNYDELYPLLERDIDRRELYHNQAYLDGIKYRKRAQYLRTCMRTGWTSDYYRFQNVKVVKGVNRCRDRFCYNCQSQDALQRFYEYSPLIDTYSKDYDIYHVVFSQPNVPGFILNQTLDLMQKSFSRLVGFLSGKKNIRGLDLVGNYGFQGAVRALEISRNANDNNYHPHYHCMVVLKKGIDITPRHFNSFSKDRTHRKEDRLFSDLEVFFQRIWYLLINGIRVTKKNLETLPQFPGGKSYPDGFSCFAENAKGHYHEIFKYSTKGAFKNGSITDDFECFRTLHDALFKRKVYQTYGCFYGIDMDVVHDNFVKQDISDICYNEILERLNSLEKPQTVIEDLKEILKVKMNTQSAATYLNLQSVRHAFEQYPPDKRQELKKLIISYFWDKY